MVETTQEGFKILVAADGSRQFMIDSDRLDECIRYIRKHNLRLIGINSFLGYTRKDVNFLRDLSDFLEGLFIPENHFDTTVVNELHRLKYLGIADNGTSNIDLSNFPDLVTLAGEMSSRLLSLETCEELRHLTLSRFHPKVKNLTVIPNLSSLEVLNLFVTNIVSLDGIERIRNLKAVSLFQATRLLDINRLGDLRSTINEIEIDKCKRIRSYEVLGQLRGLKRLIITDSGDIPSLDFIRDLYELDFFSFVGTNVKDGDLSPCIGISYVGFDNKRHYNLKFADFQKT